MLRQKWAGSIVIVFMLLVISGCGLFKSDDDSNGIDPPPPGANSHLEDLIPSHEAMNPSIENTMEVTLYFKDPDGFVVPLSMRIPATEGIARRSLEYMVEGGPGEELLPEGFQALIPQGTIVNPVNIQQKVATVDFSDHFASYNAQDERKILEAITWTLTGFPTIDQVKLRIKGHDLTEMPVNGTPMDEPLTRAMGINLEHVQGVDYGRSTPVTLYFQNQVTEEMSYYVPITRMIARTHDIAGAALTELLKGPSAGNGLLAGFHPETELLLVDHDVDNDALIVNFGNQQDGEMSAAYDFESVVMSLWENIGQKQIRIMVNGEIATAGDQQNLHVYPVNRQSDIGKSKM